MRRRRPYGLARETIIDALRGGPLTCQDIELETGVAASQVASILRTLLHLRLVDFLGSVPSSGRGSASPVWRLRTAQRAAHVQLTAGRAA